MNLFEVVKSGDFDVLDTETTGLDAMSEIVSVAVLASNGITKLNTLVHPTRAIPASATAVHGITNDMVRGALPFPSELLAHMLQGRQVVIYNAEYDVDMLYRATEHAGLPFVEWAKIATFHCAMKPFAKVYGEWSNYRRDWKWQKLSTAAAHYGIPQEGAHGALVDCQTTLKVCQAMARNWKPQP